MGRRLTCAALLLGLALTGCTDDPKPRFAEPSSPPTAESLTRGVEDLPTPTEESEESEEALVRRWQRAGSRMQVTGETTEYLALSHDCMACQRFADTIQSIYNSGATVTSSSPVMRRLKAGRTEGDARTFTYLLNSKVALVRDANGEVQQRYLGGIEKFRVQVERHEGQWFVVRKEKLR